MRDGVFDGSLSGITKDNVEAFAICMTGKEEASATSTTIDYRPALGMPSRLMHNIVTRSSIRVLRHHGLKSAFAPEGGVRYEGQ